MSEEFQFPTIYQEFIYKKTYARYVDKENRREEWCETIDRYKTFFDEKIPEGSKTSFYEAITAIKKLDIVPSMRALWTAGEALKRDNIAGYNCAYAIIDRVKVFSELLYILMCGCFHPDTLIKTKNGDKRISDITIDDEVLSLNIESNLYEFIHPILVIPTPHSSGKEKIELEFEDGVIIKCTEDHEFYTINRGWVKAKDLNEDDDIKNFNEIK